VTGFSTFLGKKGIRGRGVSPAGHTRDFLQSPYRDPLTDTVDEWDAAAHNAKLAGVPHHTFVSQWMDFQHNKYGGLTGIAPSANPLETYKEPPSAEYTEALQNAATHGVSPLEFHTHVQRHKMGIPSITDQSGAVVDPVEHFRNLGKAFSGVSGTASILGTSGQRDIIKRTEDIPYATRVVPTPETTEKLPRGIAGGATFYQSFTPTRTDIPESPELDRSAVGANPDRIIDPSLRYPTKEAAQAAARVMDMLSKMRPIDRLQEARAVGRGLAERLPKTSTSLSDIARQVKSINTRNKSAALDINPRATPEYSEAYREYQEAVNPIVKQFRASEINEMTRPYVTPAGLSGSQQLMSALSRSLESMPGGRRARVQAIEELRPQSIETGQRNRTQ
jgi:hypothetical protein